jgi:hypothetical protein
MLEFLFLSLAAGVSFFIMAAFFGLLAGDGFRESTWTGMVLLILIFLCDTILDIVLGIRLLPTTLGVSRFQMFVGMIFVMPALGVLLLTKWRR